MPYDAFGHKHATDAARMLEKAEEHGRKLEQIFKQLSQSYDEVECLIFSYHGMVPSTKGVDQALKTSLSKLQ